MREWDRTASPICYLAPSRPSQEPCGKPTWLPKTEYVGLFDPETESMAFALWDRLQHVVADKMELQECYPPRWLVLDFPSLEHIKEMEAETWVK